MFDIGTKEEKDDMQKQKYAFELHPEVSDKEMLSMEKEMLGIYISGHPLEKYRNLIKKQTTISSFDLNHTGAKNGEQSSEQEEYINKSKFKDGQYVKYAGIITGIKKKYTKNNKIMAFVTIEDLYGSAEIIVFEGPYMNSKDSLYEENIVIVNGRLSVREDEMTIIATDINDFEQKNTNKLIFDITGLDEKKKDRLRGGICYFSGDKNNMQVFVKIGEEEKSCGAIFVNEKILELFKKILGEERVDLC